MSSSPHTTNPPATSKVTSTKSSGGPTSSAKGGAFWRQRSHSSLSNNPLPSSRSSTGAALRPNRRNKAFWCRAAWRWPLAAQGPVADAGTPSWFSRSQTNCCCRGDRIQPACRGAPWLDEPAREAIKGRCSGLTWPIRSSKSWLALAESPACCTSNANSRTWPGGAGPSDWSIWCSSSSRRLVAGATPPSKPFRGAGKAGAASTDSSSWRRARALPTDGRCRLSTRPFSQSSALSTRLKSASRLFQAGVLRGDRGALGLKRRPHKWTPILLSHTMVREQPQTRAPPDCVGPPRAKQLQH